MMDTVLGAIGALFFLLIVLSTNRRGETIEGINLTGDMLLITVDEASKFAEGLGCLGDTDNSLQYYIAVLQPESKTEIEHIFFTDINLKDNNINEENPFVKVSERQCLKSVMLSVAENQILLFGVWLQDIYDDSITANDLNDSKPIRIQVERINSQAGYKASQWLELRPSNNFFDVCQFTGSNVKSIDLETKKQFDPTLLGLKLGIPAHANMRQRKKIIPSDSFDNFDLKVPHSPPVFEYKCDFMLVSQSLAHSSAVYDTGICRYYGSKDEKYFNFRFLGQINSSPSGDWEKRLGYFKYHAGKTDSYLYAAVGIRGMCLVDQNKNLHFTVYNKNGVAVAPLPLRLFQNNKIGFISSTEIIKITGHIKDRIKDVPNISYTDNEFVDIIAEQIAQPNCNKAPYTILRQNPLLWCMP